MDQCPKMRTTVPRIERIVRDIAAKEDVQNYQIIHSYIGNKGDGYCGQIQAMQIAGTNKTVDIVVKSSGGECESFPFHAIYQNEIAYYEKVLPAYAQLNEEYKIADPFRNSAKFYGALKEKDKECIVLENIKTKNFELWDRQQPMDSTHLELAIKMLAKFHGTSFAFKAIKPEAYQELSETLLQNEVFYTIIEKMEVKKQIRQLAEAVVDVFDERSEYQYWKKMRDFASISGETYEELITLKSDMGTVLLHGDYWCNNLMFQYDDLKDRSRPKNINFLDFQLAKDGSPVIDLLTFFYASASQEFLANEMYFLNLYHDALAQHVRQFNLNLDEIYSNQDLIADWKKFNKLGLVFAILFKKLMLVNTEDVTEFNNTEYCNGMVLRDSNLKVYNQHVRELVKHCVDHQYM